MTTTDPCAVVSMSASGVQPTLAKDEQGGYALKVALPALRLALQLDAAQVRALGLMCLHHFPDVEPRYAVPAEEDAYRLPARKIGLLDDRAIQTLLRETSAEALIAFLWYMKDAALAKLFFRNMSQRSAQMLLDDLTSFSGRGNPDSAALAYVEGARRSTLEILDIVGRLQADGQIPLI